MIGNTLAHYTIVAGLGKGGMGEVYVAEDAKLHRRVALKVLPEAMAADPERRARFEREALAVAALNHPNIVTIHSVEEADGVHFITMELVEGQTLTKMLPRSGFSLSELLQIAIPLADAVSSAHRSGITHRDLKPDNIMVDGEGRLKVLDFGLAKLHDPADTVEEATQAPTAAVETEEGKILGTVAYMSPEQAEGKPIDSRTDIFSMGTILYEMATGERPFRGDTKMSTIGSILKDEPASVTESNRTLPRHLGRIIRRCLAKDPDRRYQTALDLRNELEELKAEIDSGELAPEGEGATPRLWRGSRKLALLAVVVIATIVGAITVRWSPPATRPGDSSAKLIPAETKRITFAAGPEFSGDMSPGSEFLVYAHTKYGTMDLYVQPRTGGPGVRLTQGVGDEDHPRWSRDGTQIAYLAGEGTSCEVFTISPLGGPASKLADTRLPYIHSFWDAMEALGDRPWSLNDKSLLFSQRLDTGGVAIFQVDLETGDEKQITFPPTGARDLGSSWSFDGEWIVFSRSHGGASDLWLLSVSGGEARPLLQDGFVNRYPTFLPSDKHIIFGSNRSGMENLWGIHVATGELSQLTFGGGKDWYPNVSTDGTIAYTRWSHQTDLYALEVSTDGTEHLTSWVGDNFAGRYSPGGDRVAYQSTRTGNAEVWILDLNTRDELNISNHPATDVLPAWSPTGDEIAFLSNRDGPMNIWVSKADGSGRLDRLSTQEVNVPSAVWAVSLSIRWTPDGKSIGYVMPDESGPTLWTIDRHDGANRKPVRPAVLRFDWYLDGNRIIYSTLTEDGLELRAANLETNEERLLYAGPHTEMIVAPDGTAIALVKSESHFDQGLFRLRLEPPAAADGLPTPVGELERLTDGQGLWHVHNGGWSHDGKWIVYTQDTDNGDIYLLTIDE
jgi:Tol biopolymer transport system component